MKIKHLLIGMLAVAAAVACKQDEPVETPKLDVDKEAVAVAAVAGEASFNVTSNQSWGVTWRLWQCSSTHQSVVLHSGPPAKLPEEPGGSWSWGLTGCDWLPSLVVSPVWWGEAGKGSGD